jgi:hypothetical protein
MRGFIECVDDGFRCSVFHELLRTPFDSAVCMELPDAVTELLVRMTMEKIEIVIGTTRGVYEMDPLCVKSAEEDLR